jgi:hypothetical protein
MAACGGEVKKMEVKERAMPRRRAVSNGPTPPPSSAEIFITNLRPPSNTTSTRGFRANLMTRTSRRQALTTLFSQAATICQRVTVACLTRSLCGVHVGYSHHQHSPCSYQHHPKVAPSMCIMNINKSRLPMAFSNWYPARTLRYICLTFSSPISTVRPMCHLSSSIVAQRLLTL